MSRKTFFEECVELQRRHERLMTWLEDALSRNQIVHESDRQKARAFVDEWKGEANDGSGS